MPEGVTGQDEAGRLHDLVWMTRFAILRHRAGGDRFGCALRQNDNHKPKLVKLVAVCGPLVSTTTAEHHVDAPNGGLSQAKH